MDEKLKLNSELNDVNRDKFDIISKQEKELMPEYQSLKVENETLADKIILLQKEIDTYEVNRQEFLRERENNNQILKMSKEEIQHLQKMLEDLEKTSDSYLVRQKQDTINDLIHEKSIIEKDKQFFKLKAEKLEEKLFVNEKHLLRLEADSKYGASEVNHALRVENESLRDELYCEKRNKHSTTNLRAGQKLHDISDHANSENDRVKQILRRRIDQKIDDLSTASINRDHHSGYGGHRELYTTME